MPEPICYTLGHSTRTLDQTFQLLQENGITQFIDVRRFPGSRRFPQFNSDALARELPTHGIQYVHLPALGGRRKPQLGSTGFWRSEGFRGYAEYMQTAEFREALDTLLELIRQRPSVIVCSEALPWRCHRQLISDALLAHGAGVLHIMGPHKTQKHRLHEHARVTDDKTVVYVA